MRRCVWVILLLFGCGPRSDQMNAEPCVFAWIAAQPLTSQDILELKAHMAPPPTDEEAARLLVDMVFAQYILDGAISSKDPRARLADYQRWHAALTIQEPDLDKRSKLALVQLHTARRAAPLRIGQCPLSAALTTTPT